MHHVQHSRTFFNTLVPHIAIVRPRHVSTILDLIIDYIQTTSHSSIAALLFPLSHDSSCLSGVRAVPHLLTMIAVPRDVRLLLQPHALSAQCYPLCLPPSIMLPLVT